LIQVVKGNNITIITREKKKVLCWHPLTGRIGGNVADLAMLS
jgi:hypothetical protein